MLGKYLWTSEDNNKILRCSSSELEEKNEEIVQYFKNFCFFKCSMTTSKVWVDLDDENALLLKAKLKVIVKGKSMQELCNMHAFKRYR